MMEQEYSITRSRASFKPRVTLDDLPFFQDSAQNVLLGISGSRSPLYSGSGRTVVAEPPYAQLDIIVDTDRPNSKKRIAFIEIDDVTDKILINYRIEGGFNNNCITVTWESKDAACQLEWVCLKTFTGVQLKYAMPKKRSRLVFALADEDAFVYCDKTPCEECGFRCKNGFILYAFVRGLGMVRIPLDRISTSKFLS